jgi:antitoxin (DNA-binding transcriptional repressor) of toxin-antitoxin stability system
MTTRAYSIASARKHFSKLVDEAAAGATVHIHRRGALVAVLVSPAQLGTVGPAAEVADTYLAWREKFDIDHSDLDPDEVFAGVRDRSPGRDVRW